MGQATIIGIKRLEYTNKSGRDVKGWSLHYGEHERNLFGLSAKNTFVNDEVFKPLFDMCKGQVQGLINKNCYIEYNSRGWIESLAQLNSQG